MASSSTVQWERDYVALYQEFQDFQSAMARLIKSEASAVTDKTALIKLENEKIKNEFETQKVKSEALNREFQREKSCYECEIRTLRDDLDETRQKLQEKSILCDTLTRELDVIKFKAFPATTNDDTTQLSMQFKSEQARNSFLQQEIKCSTNRNEHLLKEIENIQEQHHSITKDLRDKIHQLELSLLHETEEFAKTNQALNNVMTMQQSYISELEEELKGKEDENHEIMMTAQNNSAKCMEDSLKTMQKLEIENAGMLQLEETLKKELAKMRENFKHSLDNIQAYQKLYLHLCKEGLTSINPDIQQDFGTMPRPPNIADSSRNPIASIIEDTNVECIGVDEMLTRVEVMLRKLVESIIYSKTRYEARMDNLQDRISELEEKLRLEKLGVVNHVGKLSKKCKRYGHLIRKLRRRMPSWNNVGICPLLPKPRNAIHHKLKTDKVDTKSRPQNLTKQSDDCLLLLCTTLQEKHFHFQHILNNVTTKVVDLDLHN